MPETENHPQSPKTLGEGFTCPKCGLVSHHPKDVLNRYCGNCHLFFVEPCKMCGCPYPNDHAIDCPVVAEPFSTINRRLDAMEEQLRQINHKVTAL